MILKNPYHGFKSVSNPTAMIWLASVLVQQDSAGRGLLFCSSPATRAQDEVGFPLRLTQTEQKTSYLQRTIGRLGVCHWTRVSKRIGKRHMKTKQRELQEDRGG